MRLGIDTKGAARFTGHVVACLTVLAAVASVAASSPSPWPFGGGGKNKNQRPRRLRWVR